MYDIVFGHTEVALNLEELRAFSEGTRCRILEPQRVWRCEVDVLQTTKKSEEREIGL